MLLDVADAESCRRACAEVAEVTGGGPWALVNNAGIPLVGAVEDVEDAAVRQLLEVNVVGAARMARLVLPGMRERGEGRIVNVSSLAGRIAAPGMGWYCAGKAALGALNDALRMEAGPGGVRVAVVEAGAYASAIQSRAADDLAALASRPTLFGGMYREAEAALREAGTRLPSAEPVVSAVCQAVVARRPRHRYVVGRQAKAGLLADALVPVRVRDHFKRVAMGASGAHPAVEYAARRWCTPW